MLILLTICINPLYMKFILSFFLATAVSQFPAPLFNPLFRPHPH